MHSQYPSCGIAIVVTGRQEARAEVIHRRSWRNRQDAELATGLSGLTATSRYAKAARLKTKQPPNFPGRSPKMQALRCGQA